MRVIVDFYSTHKLLLACDIADWASIQNKLEDCTVYNELEGLSPERQLYFSEMLSIKTDEFSQLYDLAERVTIGELLNRIENIRAEGDEASVGATNR